VDAESGKLRWKFATGDVVHSSPAIAGGVVYFGSFDSWLYALDAATGTLKWKFKTGEDKTNYNQVGLQSSPAVSGGVVYFGCRDSHLYAVDAATGKQKWSYDNHGTWIIASPAIHAGTVYAGTSIPGLMRAIDAATGQQRYEVDAGATVFSSAAIAGDLAYVGAFNGKLYAMDLRTGHSAWEFQTDAGKRDPLQLTGKDGKTDENRVFHSHFYEDMYRAGERLFSQGSILSSPTVDKGVIYIGSTDGNLYALD
jgi:outer membrane protein assembly factor BamB